MALALATFNLQAESVTYNVVKDDDLGTIVQGFGEIPAYSAARFWNDFGDVAGNRYNQITKDKSALLELEGWAGCTIKRITFNMCSNRSAGAARFVVATDNATLFDQTASFASADWYGEWVSFENGIYVDVTKEMTVAHKIQEDEFVSITITGTESSLYIHSYTIEYEPNDVETQSPMGYKFVKMGKNDALVDGDNVILLRSHNGILWGASYLESGANPFLGLTVVTNTQNVYEPDLLYFTAKKQDDTWLLIDQFDDTLGCAGLKHMTQNEGVMTWNIACTFDGAEIASTNESYGHIAFNTNTGDRFTTYGASSSGVVLPYLYRRGEQNQPTQATAISIDSERTTSLCQDTLVLHATFLPQSNGKTLVTDQRITWTSLDETIATVRDGIVKPQASGEVDIVATTRDGSNLSDTCHITIADCGRVTGVYIVYNDSIFTTDDTIKACPNTTVEIKAVVIPDDAENSAVKWVSEDKAKVKFDDTEAAITTFLAKKGLCKITVTTADGGYTASTWVRTNDAYCNTAVETIALPEIYAHNGTIFASGTMQIYTLTGIDVTEQNGRLNGIYMVKIGSTTHKVTVKE